MLTGAVYTSWCHLSRNHSLVISALTTMSCWSLPEFLADLRKSLAPTSRLSPPSIRSTKTNQQLFIYIKRQTLLFSNPPPFHPFRQPWNNVFIIIFAFATQMGCCSFHLHFWWGRAPSPFPYIHAHINTEHSSSQLPLPDDCAVKGSQGHTPKSLWQHFPPILTICRIENEKQHLQLESDSKGDRLEMIVCPGWWTLFIYTNFRSSN